MMKIRIQMVLVSLFVMFLAMTASAVEPGAIELKTTAEKVVVETDAEGVARTSFVRPERVIPGDKIAYTIAAKNVSELAIDRVVITDPIPEQMLFVPGMEETEEARVVFSVDGGETFDRKDRLVVTAEDGTERSASSADFTHIRWVFEKPLSPASERSVRFVAQVE